MPIIFFFFWREIIRRSTHKTKHSHNHFFFLRSSALMIACATLDKIKTWLFFNTFLQERMKKYTRQLDTIVYKPIEHLLKQNYTRNSIQNGQHDSLHFFACFFFLLTCCFSYSRDFRINYPITLVTTWICIFILRI